ncbi:MAG TPA: hypothetical protein VMY42_15835 [Thermoguttaceae bacterium]|nr:hypothetical protein [Thermoguttaceae bacterium]
MKSDWKLVTGGVLLFLATAAVAWNSALGQRPSWGGRGEGGPGHDDRGPGPPRGDDRGPGPPRGDDRSRDDRSEGDRSSSDEAQRRLQWYGEIMRNWDANGNGMIDAEEVSSSSMRKSYAERIIGQAGLEVKFPVSISKIQEGLNKRAGGDAGGSSSSSSSGGFSTESKVPGFGVETKESAPPGFGKPDDDRSEGGSRDSSGGSSGSGSSSHSGGSSGHDSDRLREHARSLLKQYDKNESGVLEKDEWSQMHRSHWSADRDHDGKITEHELAGWLEDYSQKKSDWGSSRDGGSDDPPTYRFLTAMERLPGELPEWFTEKDVNGDGQVTMAEYESDWTDTKADEFARLDPNNDGVVTPRECLAAENEQ